MERELPIPLADERPVAVRAASGPARAGSMARRLAILVVGIACFSLGLVVTLQSRVGLGPWDVFHQGLAQRLAISFGSASIAVGFAVLMLAWALGAKPGIGSFANMAGVGAFVDLYLYLGFMPDFGGQPFPVRLLIDCVGVAIVGFGTALYIKANLGAGPRDGLMLTLARRSGGRVGVIRAALELMALAIGFLLGGTAGLGTLVFALGIGPAVGLAFRVLKVPVQGKR